MSENHRKARLAFLARRKQILAQSEHDRIKALGPWPTLRMVHPTIKRPRQRYVRVDDGFVLLTEFPR